MNADLHGFWEGNVYWVYVVRGVGNCNLMVEFQTKTLDEFERVKDKVSNEFSGLIADEKTVLFGA
jgi:hypothetical protein